MLTYVHHVEWYVRDLDATAASLKQNFGFSEHASRCGENYRQVVLKSGETYFLLTERHALALHLEEEHYPIAYYDSLGRDTLFNVCLSVDNVSAVLNRLEAANTKVVDGFKLLQDVQGSVDYALIKSCVGNVHHSLVDTRKYKGSFLPGFIESKPTAKVAVEPPLTTHIDHITYVCRSGESLQILDWYSQRFGMERFLLSRDEPSDDGVVIGEDVGMRMMVGEWIASWMCREVGVKSARDSMEERTNFKLVLAEPLSGRHDSHVQVFLDQHVGPGLQHIGLHVGTYGIERTVKAMMNRGAEFRHPPPTYYKLEDKVQEITAAGCDLAAFRDLGLLLDSEADASADDLDLPIRDRSLIQIFSKPLFERDTFFLEILERRGARGFGAGNITALAKSIQLYQRGTNGNE